jgi:hypothetical protein
MTYSLKNLLAMSQWSPNQQLQRTVLRHRVRAAVAALPVCACGARDTMSRGPELHASRLTSRCASSTTTTH